MRVTTVEPETVKRCMEFAEEFCKAGKDGRDFRGNVERSKYDQVADCAMGKLGEVAFCEILRSLGYDADMSWSVWTEGGDNGSDVSIGGEAVLIDVKTVKPGSSWLIIRPDKGTPSHTVYVLMRTGSPRVKSDLICEFLGYAPLSLFSHPETEEVYFGFIKDERLYHPKLMRYLWEKCDGKLGNIPKRVMLAVRSYPGDQIRCGSPLRAGWQIGLPAVFLSTDIHELMKSL